MEKKEYFNILLRRDFIRYVLLRKPKLTSAEVSLRLKNQIEVEQLIRKMKAAIPTTLDKYLSLHKIVDKNGDIVDKLPEWLSPALADEVVKDFQARIEKVCASEIPIQSILSQIERLTWLQGVDDMAINLRKFVADIKKLSKDYANIRAHSPEEFDLAEKYKAAKRITLKERIMGNNNEDVAVFRGALWAYAQSECETAIHRQVAKLYAKIANSTEIIGVIARFDDMTTEANAEQLTTQLPEHPAEWDAEYSSLVPIEFFERNIEDIDAAMAFHMVLLQAFARHEAELVRAGILSLDGKITLFTKSFTALTNIITPIIL